jgi:hypothetical protein
MFDRDVSEDRDWWAFVRIVSYDPELWAWVRSRVHEAREGSTGKTWTYLRVVDGCSRWP